MASTRRQQVWERAHGRCEYCQLPQEFDVRPFQVDHVRARKHRGVSTIRNLAVACLPCNLCKGTNVAGYDPDTDTLHPLFNPRTQQWSEHFKWDGPWLVGLTEVGRATIEVLRINSEDRVEHRQLLIVAGVFPPPQVRCN